MARHALALLLRLVTALAIMLDMAALFGAAKLQRLRQRLVRAIYERK